MATVRQINLAKKLTEILGKRGKIGKITLTKLLEEAGYSKETARTNQRAIIEAAGTQSILRSAGVTRERLAKKFSDLLDAKKIQACNVLVKQGEDGKYEVNENSNDFIEVEDNKTQLEAAKFCAQMTDMADPETEGGSTNIQAIVNVYLPEQRAK